MNIGWHIVEQERQEAVERAMARYRAQKAREQRRVLAEERQAARGTGLGRGARRISREEAVALIARKNRRGAARLLHGLLGGRIVR